MKKEYRYGDKPPAANERPSYREEAKDVVKASALSLLLQLLTGFLKRKLSKGNTDDDMNSDQLLVFYALIFKKPPNPEIEILSRGIFVPRRLGPGAKALFIYFLCYFW